MARCDVLVVLLLLAGTAMAFEMHGKGPQEARDKAKLKMEKAYTEYHNTPRDHEQPAKPDWRIAKELDEVEKADAHKHAELHALHEDHHPTFYEYFSHARELRTEVLELFESVSAKLKDSDPEAAATVVKVHDTWLSIFGLSTGLTGLVKDFVINYHGQLKWADMRAMYRDWTWLRWALTAHKDEEARKEFWKEKEDYFYWVVNDLLKRVQVMLHADGAMLNAILDLEDMARHTNVLEEVYMRGELLGETFNWFAEDEGGKELKEKDHNEL